MKVYLLFVELNVVKPKNSGKFCIIRAHVEGVRKLTLWGTRHLYRKFSFLFNTEKCLGSRQGGRLHIHVTVLVQKSVCVTVYYAVQNEKKKDNKY
jgi:hypothetical protein